MYSPTAARKAGTNGRPLQPLSVPISVLAIRFFIPKGWTVANASGGTVSFKDNTGANNLAVAVSPDPKGLASANALVDAGTKVAKSQAFFAGITYTGKLPRRAKRNPAPSPNQYLLKWQVLPGYHLANTQSR